MNNKQYQITEPYDGWLDEFVTTREASRITGIPETSMITLRSRGGGADYVKPENCRVIRYQRRALFDFMFSGGIRKHTSEDSVMTKQLVANNDNEEGS